MSLRGGLDWAIAAVTGAQERRSPTTDRLLLAVAGSLFVATTAVSLRSLPEIDGTANWWLLLPAAALALLGIALNGGEVWLGGRLQGVRVGPDAAFASSALSSAANLLPVPGAALVKVRALRQHGLSTGVAVRSTAALGVLWVGVGLALAGILQLDSPSVMAMGTTAAGLVLAASGVAALGATTNRRRAEAVALEVGSVVTTTARLTLILAALGYGLSVSDAAALAAAGIVASAAGLFPGGLGLRELLSGVAAGVVGLDPAVGVVVAAVDRLVTLAVLAVVSAVLVATGSTPPPDTPQSEEQPCVS